MLAVRSFTEQDMFPQLCNIALYLGLMIVGLACVMILVDRRQTNPRVMPVLFQFTVAFSLMIIAACASLFILLDLFDRLQLFKTNSVSC